MCVALKFGRKYTLHNVPWFWHLQLEGINEQGSKFKPNLYVICWHNSYLPSQELEVLAFPFTWVCRFDEMGLQRKYQLILLPGSPFQTPHIKLHSLLLATSSPSLRKTLTLFINMVLFRAESTCFLFVWHFHKVEAAAFIQMEVSFLNQITSVNEVKALFTIVQVVSVSFHFCFSIVRAPNIGQLWKLLQIRWV